MARVFSILRIYFSTTRNWSQSKMNSIYFLIGASGQASRFNRGKTRSWRRRSIPNKDGRLFTCTRTRTTGSWRWSWLISSSRYKRTRWRSLPMRASGRSTITPPKRTLIYSRWTWTTSWGTACAGSARTPRKCRAHSSSKNCSQSARRSHSSGKFKKPLTTTSWSLRRRMKGTSRELRGRITSWTISLKRKSSYQSSICNSSHGWSKQLGSLRITWRRTTMISHPNSHRMFNEFSKTSSITTLVMETIIIRVAIIIRSKFRLLRILNRGKSRQLQLNLLQEKQRAEKSQNELLNPRNGAGRIRALPNRWPIGTKFPRRRNRAWI